MTALSFDEVGRLPADGDNVAIAIQRLEAGTLVHLASGDTQLSHTILEGHRFAVAGIAAGESLLSWGLPFGVALRAIAPGEYVTNPGMLEALGGRAIDFELPGVPNFEDRVVPYVLDEASFEVAAALPLRTDAPTFRGFDRGKRGVGTRNHIVVLGTTSRTAAFARQLAARCSDLPTGDHFDGVVAVAHTEGGGHQAPNNRDLLLRTLSGFATHPNVGAVLAVDYGSEAVTNVQLQNELRTRGCDTGDMPMAFLSIDGAYDSVLDRAECQIREWVAPVSAIERVERGAGDLKLALQCGGSDAFSGVSGNPLAAWVARELIRCGGAANLAETDELIGAEPYVLDKVADVDTARRFLEMVARFKARAADHGTSAEGNPSGGNKYRGLYNIVLKSIGAAMKRHPDVRLDGCLEYSEPIPAPGYYFMDSPGNDLESIAGQVASGCNLIYFVTGNGSITNFPFVPTLKLLTTTARFELLREDMDVNAGAYQDGASMDDLGQRLLDLSLRVSSGERSRGEAAGHSQVSIWRDWPRTSAAGLEQALDTKEPDGRPLLLTPPTGDPAPVVQLHGFDSPAGFHLQRIGLVMPTSLCSGQVARMAAERLQSRHGDGEIRYCALVHTEGCGVSSGPNEDIYSRSLIGYLTHPSVEQALLIEHGCEKTHNDYMRACFEAAGVDGSQFGYASVQLDGGIDRSLQVVDDWFAQVSPVVSMATVTDLSRLRLGLLSGGELSDVAARAVARVTAWIVGAGGTVVTPEADPLLSAQGFIDYLGLEAAPSPTLAHGQIAAAGFHVMEAPGKIWTESVTGLGATGVDVMLAHVGEHPLPGHPMIPLLQWTSSPQVASLFSDDLDAQTEGDGADWPEQLVRLIEAMSRQEVMPLSLRGNADFQITRGPLGVSM
ncbi:MAG: altronate hydrolase [Gemmatimonadetes bacterium]|jgi:altronate dehydratase|nr:altronate hydrolase [Gemmatimonadota bacterium]MBT6146587.1 altronate hydrolase [Gemmatimonadota bacterium]MBT7863791.1 altronate hydrolase [Gemmatimonadota bacterium]